MRKSFVSGATISMTEEQFLDSHTQSAIQREYLEVLEGIKIKKSIGQEFRSLLHRQLSIPCVGRAISPGEVFFVKDCNLEDTQLSISLALGYVVSEKDYQKERKNVNTSEKADKEEKIDEEKKSSPAKKSSDEEKKAAAEALKKAEASVKMKRKTEESAKKDNAVPKGMHVHIPEGSDALPAVRLPRASETIIELDLDAPEETVDFVDQEQKKEAESRLKKIAMDNEDII